jgi:putative oxidoreductase
MFAAGLATPLAAAAIIATMTVAIVTVHWRVGFFIFLPNGGWEYCASIIAVAAAVSIGGAGELTLDNLLGLAWDPAVGLGAVGMGFVLAVTHLALSHRPGGS